MPQTAQYPDMERQLASLISRVEELERRRPRIRNSDLDDTLFVRTTLTGLGIGTFAGTVAISFAPAGFVEKPVPVSMAETSGTASAFTCWVRSWTITNGLYVAASVSAAITVTASPTYVHVVFIGPGVTNAS